MDDTRFTEDVASLLTGKYKLADGSIVKGVASSYALKVMRNYLDNGRRWRGIGTLGNFEHECKRLGFQVTYHGHGLRIYHGGVKKYGAKAIVIHRGETVG